METNPTTHKIERNFFHIPFFLPPEANVFQERSVRFQELAAEDNSEWRHYLSLLAVLTAAQQKILDVGGIRMPSRPYANTLLPEASEGEVPPDFYTVLHKILQEVAGQISAEVESALQGLAALPQQQAEALAARVLKDEAQDDDAPYKIWIHAALQVIWTAWAQGLTEDDVPPREERSICPCCGTDAVASVVLQKSDLHNLRYLHCPMCNSRWHALRAKCTFCGDQSGISLQEIEAQSGVLNGARAESCDKCHAYRKMVMLTKQQYADPIADDLASLTLDILVGENGYRRGGGNPFL
ncbi:MAG: formate dehydrogenase accessory protein FdhE [Neisseria sp.]|uniref:formate dehydrogenase accessory protein FdhE n=1 Tax=Neisseria sp. TaxID=192066 RepID=UPI0026DBC864|nr:formate dehydrogenase accessory protein FdhE [Neisseria sp.]MDO4641571.1 formate dehydrogenase accessory protein FdhE [Neisseria sp.]